MRIVDFSTFPDRSEHRQALKAAFDGISLDGAELTEPVDVSAAVGVGLPDALGDDELRDRAEGIRAELEGELGSDFAVRFGIADAAAEGEGGAPDHLE